MLSKYIEKDYAAIEVTFPEFRAVLSCKVLIEIAQKVAHFYYDAAMARVSSGKTHMGMLPTSLTRTLNIGGASDHFLDIAASLKQKKHGETYEVEVIRFALGGRILELYNPSDRYIYDRGTFDSHGQATSVAMTGFFGGLGAMKDVLAAKEANIAKKGTDKNALYKVGDLLDTDARDAVLKSDASPLEASTYDASLGYRDLIKQMLIKSRAGVIDDVKLMVMARLVLQSHEPILPATRAEVMRNQDIVARMLKESQRKRFIAENPIDFEIAQPGASELLDEMPEQLPVLLGALLISETSRNPLAWLAGLMTFDLCQSRGVTVGGISFNFTNMLCHPRLVNDGNLKDCDPSREFSKIGGLHPMTHMGSFIEFKDNLYQCDEPMSWAHVKTVMVMMEWLSRLNTDGQASFRIVNSAEYAAMAHPELSRVEFDHLQHFLVTKFSFRATSFEAESLTPLEHDGVWAPSVSFDISSYRPDLVARSRPLPVISERYIRRLDDIRIGSKAYYHIDVTNDLHSLFTSVILGSLLPILKDGNAIDTFVKTLLDRTHASGYDSMLLSSLGREMSPELLSLLETMVGQALKDLSTFATADKHFIKPSIKGDYAAYLGALRDGVLPDSDIELALLELRLTCHLEVYHVKDGVICKRDNLVPVGLTGVYQVIRLFCTSGADGRLHFSVLLDPATLQAGHPLHTSGFELKQSLSPVAAAGAGVGGAAAMAFLSSTTAATSGTTAERGMS